MGTDRFSRRFFFEKAGLGAMAVSLAGASGCSPLGAGSSNAAPSEKRGAQRLSLAQLRKWEALGYGMFIHFGMSTFVGNEYPSGKDPATVYAPDHLDVDQWISVARDAGMKYAVLTAKHVAGHCLWPSAHTDYTVVNSTNKTDVVEQFIKACERRGVLPGLYYCSWDNHNRFWSATLSDPGVSWGHAFTTSHYQTFQTAQVTELLTQYGPIAETWIDIPGVLGRGYRTFLYQHIAKLRPETVIMMNSGIGTGEKYNVDYAWPSDLIAIERRLPPKRGHTKWRTIEEKKYYMPGEVCDTIGKNWFYFEDDRPRSDEKLFEMFQACRERGVNLLLNVPPDKHGLIPDYHVQALMRLRKNAKI